MGMTLQEIKELKKQLGLTNDQLSSLSGVPLSTVQKVLGKTTAAPRQMTLRKLEAALMRELYDRKTPDSVSKKPLLRHPEEMKSENGSPYSGFSQTDDGIYLREPPAAYHTDSSDQGKHTIRDYYSLPAVHQDILLILASLFRSYIRKNKGECRVYVAPRDVQLDPCDDTTIVQPDILVVCDRDKITSRCIVGAPDFIVEILSPSTRERDLHLKASKYANSGVREYWIIDPDRKIILVYHYTESHFPACFSFADTIPVSIWKDQLQIDFRQVSEEVSGLYEQ